MEKKRCVIVAIGNEMRGDDGIALFFAENLERERELKEVKVIKAGVDILSYLNEIEKHDKIIILDAVHFGGKGGEVKTFEIREVANLVFDTHRYSIRVLEKLLPGKKIVLVGVQPKNVGLGTSITEECKNAYEEVKKIILELCS